MALGSAPPLDRAGTLPPRPAVIGHRGASGHRPEHTLASYELAYRLGADSVELDLVATADGALVCRHDLELSRTTDVAARPEFAHLRTVVEVDGTAVAGWFVHDFTLAELRLLRARERWPKKRPGSASFNGRFAIPTLEEVLELADAESVRRGSRVQVHAELKDPGHLLRHGLDLAALANAHPAAGRPEVTWFSFAGKPLRRLTVAGPVLRILDEAPSRLQLGRISEYGAGIAVRRDLLQPRATDGSIEGPTRLVDKAHRRGLLVLAWTHRAENQHLPTQFRLGGNPRAHGDAAGDAALLFAQGIDGLITDFPEVAIAGRERLTVAALG
jgi:glycerophosphoryl diester phosphodiesterase